MDFEPELALVAACLRSPCDEAATANIQRCAGVGLSWDRFLSQVARHRVTSLVCATLDRAGWGGVPPDVAERLHAAARSHGEMSLRQIAETVRLTRRLGENGIGALVLKGPVLAVLAFDNPLLRDSRDIDLIVEAADLERVDAILNADGYRRSKPEAGTPAGQRAIYRRWVHEFCYHSPARGLVVEVKDRVDPTGSLPPRDIDAHIRAPAMVAVAGRELATLPAIDQFLYVCIHGSRHSWFRLKWIADVGALLHRLSAGELDAIARRASALGIERSLREAILLGHELLAARVPDALFAQARADRGANRRAAAARRLMAVFGRDGDPFASFGLTTRLLIEEYRIRSDWRYRRALLGRHALSYLYPLARPLLRVAQRLRSPQ